MRSLDFIRVCFGLLLPPLPAALDYALNFELQISVGTAGPQLRAPDLSGDFRISIASARCHIECQIECLIECQRDCQRECQNRCQIECQNICQIECHGGDHSKKVILNFEYVFFLIPFHLHVGYCGITSSDVLSICCFNPCQRDDDPHRNKGHQALGAVSQKAFGDPILRSGRMLDVPCQVKRTPLFWLFLVGCMTAIMDRFHCVSLFLFPADNES